MRTRIACAFLATLISAFALVACASGTPSTKERPLQGQTPCGKLHYRGEHNLFRRGRIGCQAARDTARYVLKHRKPPSGWYCYPTVASNGFGVCKRNGRAFVLWPK